MDLWHLAHAELAERVRKYKGRVVCFVVNVKYEFDSETVFTEQGASASPGTAQSSPSGYNVEVAWA